MVAWNRVLCRGTATFLAAFFLLAIPALAEPAEDWRAAADSFRIAGSGAGFLDKDALLKLLDEAESGAAAEAGGGRWAGLGWMTTALLILLGGAALNLTPCVLPMIPVNLAIIGAGARAGTRRRGFALGAVYGAGMALAYGALGLLVLLTGARFGALNASPWFNAVMAVVFILLSLAMFDIIHIDLSRFQGRGGASGGRFAAVLVMGAVAALLAGACVAPVVLSVLLLAGNLYARGFTAALLLPFLLGAGMAIPWPLAGAGMAFLPKPGKWMNVIKSIFGVLILALAVYYGHLAYRLFKPAPAAPTAAETPAGEGVKVDAPEAFGRALREAYTAGQPVFIDFWATWCKNCLVMDRTTFKDPDVRARLAKYRMIKFQAEFADEPPASEVLDYFKAIGLPTYVVLMPK